MSAESFRKPLSLTVAAALILADLAGAAQFAAPVLSAAVRGASPAPVRGNPPARLPDAGTMPPAYARPASPGMGLGRAFAALKKEAAYRFRANSAENGRVLRSVLARLKPSSRGTSSGARFLGDAWEGIRETGAAFARLASGVAAIHDEAPAESFPRPRVPEPEPERAVPSRAFTRMVKLLLQTGKGIAPGGSHWPEGRIWREEGGGARWPSAPGRPAGPLALISQYTLVTEAEEGNGPAEPAALLEIIRGFSGEDRSKIVDLIFVFSDNRPRPSKVVRAVPMGSWRVQLAYEDGRTETLRIAEVGEVSPLVLDLDGDGALTSARRVLFDLDGDGVLDRSNDIAENDALLVFDADGDGVSGEDGRELFGDATDLVRAGGGAGHADGFASLKDLVARAAAAKVIDKDSAARGTLDKDALAALEKAFGLKLKRGGLNAPAASLADAGIIALSLADGPSRRVENFDGRGNAVSWSAGARFERADGTGGVYGDVWFNRILSGTAPAAVRSPRRSPIRAG